METLYSAFRKQWQSLIQEHHRVLIACSGGLDSVVLAHLLGDYYRNKTSQIALCHCHFGLRGEDSDRDEAFVVNLAMQLHCPCFHRRFDTYTYQHQNNISTQMAARELRYAFFEEIRQQNRYDFIVLAHHSDDQLETFFINLLRGSGLKGLRGMIAKQGFLLRPLLDFSRQTLENYALQKGYSHCEDASNADDKYLRNRIRHHLLPCLDQMAPQARQALRKSMDNLYVAEQEGLDQLLIWQQMEFTPSQIRQMRKAQHQESAGQRFFSPSHEALADRGEIICRPRRKETREDIEVLIDEHTHTLFHPLDLRFDILPAHTPLEKNPKMAFLDAEKLRYPLLIRRWKPGDAFVPLGQKGRKKLSDFFIDEKWSLYDKENAWLLCSGNDIVWVIGHRIDHRYRLTENTQHILRICPAAEQK